VSGSAILRRWQVWIDVCGEESPRRLACRTDFWDEFAQPRHRPLTATLTGTRAGGSEVTPHPAEHYVRRRFHTHPPAITAYVRARLPCPRAYGPSPQGPGSTALGAEPRERLFSCRIGGLEIAP
jgi:hypothetical protein